MTPEDPESRRDADELRRRERRARQPEPALDSATLAALLEKHQGEVARIVGQAEKILSERIDALAAAQGAAAENVRREIERGLKHGGEADEGAALGRLGEEQRAALNELSVSVREGLNSLTKALDHREGTIFDRIDHVAERVAPGAEALDELRQAVAGATDAARDVAAIKDAAVASRRALDEAAAVRQTVTDNTSAMDDATRAMNDVAELRPVLGAVVATHGAWNATARRWFWLALILLVVFGLACGAAGVALQRETAVWPTPAEVGIQERDSFWERHGMQVMHCINVARAYDRGMACSILDPDP
ncbi:MAG: hypothetical protein OXQ84_02145 [bacterium]|nr:hypothetical protein [bacterium]